MIKIDAAAALIVHEQAAGDDAVAYAPGYKISPAHLMLLSAGIEIISCRELYSLSLS